MTDAACIGDLPADDVAARLAGPGLAYRCGPFAGRVRCSVPELVAPWRALYHHHPHLPDPGVLSYHVDLHPVPGRRGRQLVRFSADGRVPHDDMPRAQALPVLEWGVNLVTALRAHHLVMFHAGAMERNGHGLLLPGQPGAGKTTLCAALANEGFRFLSDEFGLVRPGTAELLPVPRPLPLKDRGAALLMERYPGAVFGPTIHGTRKGDVTHMAPPRASVEAAQQPAPVHWVVLPEFAPGAAQQAIELSPHDAFVTLASNAFNYELVGEQGFATVSAIVRQSRALLLRYHDLDMAVRWLTELTDGAEGADG